MDEEERVSLPQSIENAASPGLLEDKLGQKHYYSSPKDIGNKENLCLVPVNDSDMPASSKETPLQTTRTRKAGGCNLRKSLAWNKAFFTEEGVLNPLELCVLTGSFSNSRGNFLSPTNEGGMSPLMGYNRNSDRLMFRDHEETLCSRMPQTPRSQTSKKAGKLFSKPEASIIEEPQAHATGKPLSAKGICRNIPQPPTTYSQKRAANMNSMNPASKLPKFTATKSHLSSLSMTSRNAMLSTKSSKSNQSVTTVNFEQNVGSKGSSLSTRKDLGCIMSSAKSSMHDVGRNMVRIKKLNEIIVAAAVKQTSETHSSSDLEAPRLEKGSVGLKVSRNLSLSTKLHEPVGCAGSGKVASLFPQNIRHACEGPPALCHSRPSALRMPSPSLGFFCQAKVSPSQNNQYQGNTKLSESSTPSLGKPINVKRTSELRPPLASTGRQHTVCSAATKSTTGAVTIGSTKTSFAANSLSSSIPTLDAHPAMKLNLGSSQLRGIALKDSFDFGSSNCQSNDQEQLHSDCLAVGDNIDMQSGITSIRKPGPEGVKNITYQDSTVLQVNNDLLFEESEISEKSPEDNCSENAHNADPPTQASSRSKLPSPNSLSQICSPKQLKESDSGVDNLAKHSRLGDARFEACAVTFEDNLSAGNSEKVDIAGPPIQHSRRSELSCPHRISQICSPKQLQESNSGLDNLAKYPHVGDAEGDACTVTIEDNQSGGNSDFGFGHTSENTAASMGTELSMRLSQEQTAGAGLCSSLEPVCSSTGKVGMSLEEATSGIVSQGSGSSSLLSEFQSDESELPEEGALMPEKEKLLDKLKPDAVQLKYQLNAAPFSDEWVAALEDFGEGILGIKTGPVQNSPPDKALPEPGPWSPVKRKAQDVGPFDCTKYSKNLSTSDTQ